MENMLEYYKSHPSDFKVTKHSTKDLYIVKYQHASIDWSQPYALDARGIVLDGKGNVVARPYKKFFNLGELEGRELPEDIIDLCRFDEKVKSVVYDKLDGSLVTAFLHEGEVMFASSGSLEGEFPNKFMSWAKANFTERQWERLKNVLTHYTLLFEYIGPDNRIVIPYDQTAMVLHGAIETQSGLEVTAKDPDFLSTLAWVIGVDAVKPLNIRTLEDLLEAKEADRHKVIEGFIIVFNSGKRLKIKTDEYVALHGKHTLSFGAVSTKRKIKLYIDLVVNDEIDDILPIFQQRGDNESIELVNHIIRLNSEVELLHFRAKQIRAEEDFDKKNYALSLGTSSTLDKFVLADNMNSLKKAKIRESYIKEQLERLGY